MGHGIEPGRGSELDGLLRLNSVVEPKCMEGRRVERLREMSRLKIRKAPGLILH